MNAKLDARIWHDVKSASAYSGFSERTVLNALRDGTLKGGQRVVGGHWRIHIDALDAWMGGGPR